MNGNQVVSLPPRATPALTLGDMERLAESIAESGLFSIKTKQQALVLLAISQAEGRHPALAARDYDIIQNRPAKKAEAMMRDFLESGGKVEWHTLDDANADATFSHPAGGTVRIAWNMERVKNAGLLGKDNYKKYPRQMLRSRCVSEGVRTVCPMATSGMYVPEEVADFEPRKPIDVTPPKPVAMSPATIEPPHDPETGEIGPHVIALPRNAGGGGNWVVWGQQLIAAIRSAESDAVVTEWLSLNTEALAECKEFAPKAHGSISRAIADANAKLAEPEPFEVVDMVGEAKTYDTADAAADAYRAALDEAEKQKGEEGLKTVFDNNSGFFNQLDDRGLGDLSREFSLGYGQRREAAHNRELAAQEKEAKAGAKKADKRTAKPSEQPLQQPAAERLAADPSHPGPNGGGATLFPLAEVLERELAAADSSAAITEIELRHKVELNRLPYEQWLPLQAKIDQRRAAVEGEA